MTARTVTITYHAAAIIADLLPGKHLTDEASQAVVEFLVQVVRTRKQIAAEPEQDHPDT